jgi:hypothetical protein
MRNLLWENVKKYRGSGIWLAFPASIYILSEILAFLSLKR